MINEQTSLVELGTIVSEALEKAGITAAFGHGQAHRCGCMEKEFTGQEIVAPNYSFMCNAATV